MDNNAIFQQFEEIEQKVERLIGVCKSLEVTKSELLGKVDKLENELREKNESEKKFAEEKTLIRSRIDSLLARLEDITEATE